MGFLATREMKIFILEDSPERIGSFIQMFDDHDVVVVNCAMTARCILSVIKFDLILLDHDLGGQVYVDSEQENTGYQVAKYIPTTQNKTTRVVIHSWNGVGAQRMMSALEYAEEFTGKKEQKMFGTFDEAILYN